MSDPFAYWRAALAGEKPTAFVDTPMCGFYRKGVYERGVIRDGVFIPDERANNRRVGWEPVAIYMQMRVRVGNDDFPADSIDIWSWVADQPISEELYRAVSERNEPWPEDVKRKGKFA